MSTPSSELVDAYLTEIAKAYNVEWAATRKSGRDDSPEGGVKVSPYGDIPVPHGDNNTSFV
jgi:vacuolar protein sorting-associated protein IST1